MGSRSPRRMRLYEAYKEIREKRAKEKAKLASSVPNPLDQHETHGSVVRAFIPRCFI